MFFDERETEVGTCSRPHWVSGGKEEAGWEQGLLGTAVSSNPNSLFERQLSAHCTTLSPDLYDQSLSGVPPVTRG